MPLAVIPKYCAPNTASAHLLMENKNLYLFVGNEVELIENGVVLGQVFVLELLLLLAKDGAVDLLLFGLLHRLAGDPPFLEQETVFPAMINLFRPTGPFMAPKFII